MHIPRERATHVEAIPAGNYLADDLPNSVQITLAHCNQYVANDPERYTKLAKARQSKLRIWLLASAVISVTTLYPCAAGIHGAPTGRNSASAVQPQGETAICNMTGNSVVRGVRPAAPASLRDVDRSAAQHYGSSSGAHRTLASDRDETGTRENSRVMVPPPPPTPCVLPPAFGFFPMQPAQQNAAPQQQLQSAALESTPQQPTAASDTTEATQSAALVDADQKLQAALSSSLRTMGEWTR
jgi:hypothetical protein